MSEPVDTDATAAELLARAADDYAAAEANRAPQLPALRPELAALAAVSAVAHPDTR